MTVRPDGNHHQPLMGMNMTPLIDVFLVLLIMIIITFPAKTHVVELGIPACSINLSPTAFQIEPIRNRLEVTADNQLLWNKTPVSLNQVKKYLAQTRTMVPEPELQFQPDAHSDYLTTNRVIAAIKQSGIAQFGLVGNEQYGSFNKATNLPN